MQSFSQHISYLKGLQASLFHHALFAFLHSAGNYYLNTLQRRSQHKRFGTHFKRIETNQVVSDHCTCLPPLSGVLQFISKHVACSLSHLATMQRSQSELECRGEDHRQIALHLHLKKRKQFIKFIYVNPVYLR